MLAWPIAHSLRSRSDREPVAECQVSRRAQDTLSQYFKFIYVLKAEDSSFQATLTWVHYAGLPN